MSGRKSFEVLDLLSSGKAIREKTQQNIYKNIEELKKKNIELIKVIKNIKEKLLIKLPQMSEEIREKYEIELKAIDKLLEQLENFRNIVPHELIEDEKQLIKLEDEMKILDKRGDELRERVRYRSDYCNTEYSMASDLVREYNEKKNTIVTIERNMTNKVRNNASYVEEGNQLEIVKTEIEEQYKNIKERHLADNNKVQIEKELTSIPEKWAKKFAGEEYESLKSEIVGVLEKGITNEINNKAKYFFEEITIFKNKIMEKKKEYELKKQQISRELDEINDKVGNVTYGDIEVFDSDIQIGLFEFEKKYCRYSNEKDFEDKVIEIKTLYNKEEFDLAIKKLESLRKETDNFIGKASKQYEKLLKEQEIVGKIVIAMDNLGYDIAVNCLDDDIRNGYTIEAIAGEEIINFDEISIDESGNPIIKLDHQESINGTCGKSMKEIMKAIQDEGIFVTDILKDGNSVIYPDKRKIVTNTKVEKTATR